MIVVVADKVIAQHFPGATEFAQTQSVFFVRNRQIKELEHAEECGLHAGIIAIFLRAARTRYLASDMGKL